MESTDSNAIKDPRVRAAIEHYLLDIENTSPKNTAKNYDPKEKEWRVSTYMQKTLRIPNGFPSNNKQAWCEKKEWGPIPPVWPPLHPLPVGEQLPGDLVDEGKLLLFMSDFVTKRAPLKGKRLANEKKRHLEEQGMKKAAKRQKKSTSGKELSS